MFDSDAVSSPESTLTSETYAPDVFVPRVTALFAIASVSTASSANSLAPTAFAAISELPIVFAAMSPPTIVLSAIIALVITPVPTTKSIVPSES